ncbi:MAG: ABC transporter ATP-binding protein [Candidatus Nanopelagicales bacterium]|jgi:NitT/TauT family transport system ATP-binding protein|nr:ABC transporter ATP-binding protein [Candidatus Nanopelagicales bacterium]
MDSPAVSVEDVTKIFNTKSGAVVALQDISVTLAAGEFISLIGPSGCGKSTLLNIIGGLTSATAGKVLVHGASVTAPPEEAGMMFQKPVLLEWRTILSNVLLPIELKSGKRESTRHTERAMDLLSAVGLADFAAKYPHELSGGMQQRAAICRMLISDPQLLLLDEPFGALDELTREQLNLQLDRIVEGVHKTSILVTHSISEGTFLSDRVLVMSARPGRVIGVVDVDLPRPRTLDMMQTGEFLTLTNRVRLLLESGHDFGDEAISA